MGLNDSDITKQIPQLKSLCDSWRPMRWAVIITATVAAGYNPSLFNCEIKQLNNLPTLLLQQKKVESILILFSTIFEWIILVNKDIVKYNVSYCTVGNSQEKLLDTTISCPIIRHPGVSSDTDINLIPLGCCCWGENVHFCNRSWKVQSWNFDQYRTDLDYLIEPSLNWRNILW